MPLDPMRRAVLIDMAYEIGGSGLSKFIRFLAYMRSRDYENAITELKHSLLYSQVKSREDSNITILRTGLFPTGINSAEELIKLHEGCILKAKPDAKGMWAYGYGHDIPPPPDGKDLVCTQGEAEAWFVKDFARAQKQAEAALGSQYW